MSSKEERAEIQPKVDALLMSAANGSCEAFSYLQGFGHVARVLDDLVDGDVEVSRDDILFVFRWLLVYSLQNPFFMQNAPILSAYHASALSAWELSNEMEGGNERQRIYGHVLRDWCCSIIPAVANLTGGYEHMRKIEKETWAIYAKPLGG